MVELTKQQLKYKEAAQWLISGGRAQGKSFLLAYCYAEHAFNRVGEPVFITEINSHHRQYDKYLLHTTMEILTDMCNEYNKTKPIVQYQPIIKNTDRSVCVIYGKENTEIKRFT